MVSPLFQRQQPSISPDFTVPSSRQGMSGAPIDWAARRRAQEAERNRKEIERMAQGAVSGTSSIVTERILNSSTSWISVRCHRDMPPSCPDSPRREEAYS